MYRHSNRNMRWQKRMGQIFVNPLHFIRHIKLSWPQLDVTDISQKWMLDMKWQKGWWAKFILLVYLTGFVFFFYSLSIFSKYSLILFPFRRKYKSIKIIFTSSAATSSMVIQSGCLLLLVRNSSAWALHREKNNSVFLMYFRFKLLKCGMEKWMR